MNKRMVIALAAAATLILPTSAAQAYKPTGGIVYQLGAEPCLKGRGNCAIYPKSAQLPGGRLVATFEKATVVPATGSADGETLPVYKSDDYGTTWQLLSEVKAPAYLSNDPRYAKYTSNWTNPYLYVLPQGVGRLKAGTLLLASVVSGDDYFYKEHKAADPNWTPSNDGDRKDMAIALFSSTDGGLTWRVVNVIATGGWQGGSAGAIGRNVAAANTYRQVDPLWEPYLAVHRGKLVCYYSDENDYLGFDPATGVARPDPENDTAADSHNQVLVHRTWDGRGPKWTDTVVDVPGLTVDMGGGKTEIGGGRPGMTNVVQTTGGKWLITYEYWGGGANVRYKVAADPLRFYADGDPAGNAITTLPVAPGSRSLAQGGSPVLIRLPGGRLVYNAAGSGNVWVNESGRSDRTWTEYQTPLGPGYSRNLQYVEGTGRVVILRNQGISTIAYGEVDLGHSDGAYYQLVNRKTGQV
ncbi:sialidase family protein, partial [Pseudonocardia sp.]|uniref:sialidase family protein n=1 Tax=Pseudonocardia sp. TaxID=60912 RepID=UPI0031FD56C2